MVAYAHVRKMKSHEDYKRSKFEGVQQQHLSEGYFIGESKK